MNPRRFLPALPVFAMLGLACQGPAPATTALGPPFATVTLQFET